MMLMLLCSIYLASPHPNKALEEPALCWEFGPFPTPSQVSQHLSGSCCVLAKQWLPLKGLNSNNMESLVPDLRDFQHELNMGHWNHTLRFPMYFCGLH